MSRRKAILATFTLLALISVGGGILVQTAKHLAFTRCGELDLYGMVEAQVATLESELLAGVV